MRVRLATHYALDQRGSCFLPRNPEAYGDSETVELVLLISEVLAVHSSFEANGLA